MNKKAFLRTVEAVIAIIITFLVLVIIFPKNNISEYQKSSLNNLDLMKDDEILRNCIYLDNLSCVENIITNYLPASYEFQYLVTSNPNDFIYNLPKTRIYTKNLIFAGNNQVYDFRILKIYYWLKNN